MALTHTFDTTTTAGKISQDIWDGFVDNYNYVKNRKNPFIYYPDRKFKSRGIPTYRQPIAWKKPIKLIGEENFSSLPFELNYLRETDTKFFEKFNEVSKDSKKLEIIFVCGYFWRFHEERRYSMVNFVVDNMLKKGYSVKIWTEDKTLKKNFKEIMEEKKLDLSLRKNLQIKRKLHRFDIHYTLIKDKDDNEKTFVFMELPHTEAHNLRLETYFPFKQLKSFCSIEKFERILNSHRIWNPFKSLFSFFNIALNIG